MPNSIHVLELVKLLKEGNVLAFKQVYNLYFDKAFDTALIILKNNTWAEDIVQDTFTIIWHNRENLNETLDIWYYIFVLIKNNCINKLRLIKKDQNLKDQLYAAIQEQKSYQEDLNLELEISKKIAYAKSLLTPQQRLIYDLCKEEGFSYHEVANKLNISKNTVKNHMVNSFKILRTHVDKDVIFLMFFFLK